MDANKLENIISGYGISADDAAWLRAIAQPVAVDAWLAESRKAREEMRARLDAVAVQAPPAAPVVTLPCGWHIVPRHLPDEVLVDTGCIDGYDGQRGDAEHRAWWESAIDSLAVRVPCPVLTYTQAPPAAVPAGYALVPVEPTTAMKCRAVEAWEGPAVYKSMFARGLADLEDKAADCWTAMLAASKGGGNYA